nr:c-type cytochrome [Sulfurivermis fontis]
MSQKTNTYFGTSVVTLVVVGGLVALILNIMTSVLGGGTASADMSAAAVEARIKPVGKLNTGAPIAVAAAPAPAAAAPAAARSGDAVYNASCVACHGTGAAGAPKLGDKAAWGDRIAQGMDTLVKHAISGFQGKSGVMPPRGTCGTCSDGELKAAVEYMVSKAK